MYLFSKSKLNLRWDKNDAILVCGCCQKLESLSYTCKKIVLNLFDF